MLGRPGRSNGGEATGRKAIKLDPGYGFAHALGATLALQRWYEDLGDSNDELEEVCALATRAVVLDDGESTNQAVLRHVYVAHRAYDLAVQRVVEINPSDQWNAADPGSILVHAG